MVVAQLQLQLHIHDAPQQQQQHCQQHQYMYPTTTATSFLGFYKSFSSKSKLAKQHECPFKMLGVSSGAKYKYVKQAFLKLAMRYHPDLVHSDDYDDVKGTAKAKEEAEDKFIEIRHAFERIRPLECGGAAAFGDGFSPKDGLAKDEAVDKFDDWFYSETGQQPIGSFSLDRETMMEVAKMEGEVEHGLDRDGGMWHLAGMIANSVKQGVKGGADNVLKLTMGDDVSDNEEFGPTNRRKRRRGRGQSL